MKQEVKYIAQKDLVLCTEDPRGTVSAKAKDQDIVDSKLGEIALYVSMIKEKDEMMAKLERLIEGSNRLAIHDARNRKQIR